MATALATIVAFGAASHSPAAGDATPEEPSAAAVSPPRVEAVTPNHGDVDRTGEARVVPGRHIERSAHPLPSRSGGGRRIVFSQSEQRVWLVDDEGEVQRTHPVSGSRLDNLFPGTYEVFSRSRHAVAYDHSSTMAYFVRFTRGTGGSAIGFHDIPRADGSPVQSHAELGKPLSAGCIRQRRADAIAVWEFAPVGTPVVVTR